MYIIYIYVCMFSISNFEVMSPDFPTKIGQMMVDAMKVCPLKFLILFSVAAELESLLPLVIGPETKPTISRNQRNTTVCPTQSVKSWCSLGGRGDATGIVWVLIVTFGIFRHMFMYVFTLLISRKHEETKKSV